MAAETASVSEKMQNELAYQTLIELFNKSLAKSERGPKPYLEIVRQDRRENLTFEQLKTAAEDFAVWLIQTKGILIGDRIGILGKNRVDWDVALWGSLLAGAVPVLIDAERPVEAVGRHIITTDTRAIIVADDYQDADSRRQLEEFAAGRGVGVIEMTGRAFCALADDERCSRPDVLSRAEPARVWGPCKLCRHDEDGRNAAKELLRKIEAEVRGDDTAVIVCTSGTTDDPREVELTHTNLIANIQGALAAVKITDKDRLGHIIPPHHSFGFAVTKILPLWAGATNIYTNKYRQIPEIIRDRKITVFIGIPAFYTVLAKTLEEHLAGQKQTSLLVRLADRFRPRIVGKKIIKKQGWENLRFFLSGAAPMPRWVLEAFWKRSLPLYEGYGTTENSPIYGFNKDCRKLGSVGRPIDTLLVKIVDEQGRTLKPGEKGEIVLGGPCIMKGYYKNPNATKAVIKTDDKGLRWLHTGDLGYLDRQGHLFITGRKKYVIVLPCGKKVNPEVVESVLSQAQYVGEVLVVADTGKSRGADRQTTHQPGGHTPSAGQQAETLRAIVRPAWEEIESRTNLPCCELIRQPEVLKKLIWESINNCQQRSRQLSRFEKVSANCLEIRTDEFAKTSSGKIKRELYIETSR